MEVHASSTIKNIYQSQEINIDVVLLSNPWINFPNTVFYIKIFKLYFLIQDPTQDYILHLVVMSL